MFNERNDGDDPFASIDGADPSGQRNPYLLDGQYCLRIEKCSMIKSRQKKTFFLVECVVEFSDNPERPMGMHITWMTNLDSDMGPVNTKRFLSAANGLDPSSPEAKTEITGEVAKLAVSNEQPLRGTKVYAQAQSVKTRDGGDFTDVRWEPCNEP